VPWQSWANKSEAISVSDSSTAHLATSLEIARMAAGIRRASRSVRRSALPTAGPTSLVGWIAPRAGAGHRSRPFGPGDRSFAPVKLVL
jgi:hypothetical protein